MNVTLVDSKKKKLQPGDVLIVAAHQNKVPANEMKAQSKKSDGISPAKLLYTAYVQEMQNPSLIRIQENNTLFVIHPVKERVGVLRMFNGDTLNNLPKNISTFFESAYKVGADILLYPVDSNTSSAFKQAFDMYQNEGKEFSSKTNMIIVVLGKQRS